MSTALPVAQKRLEATALEGEKKAALVSHYAKRLAELEAENSALDASMATQRGAFETQSALRDEEVGALQEAHSAKCQARDAHYHALQQAQMTQGKWEYGLCFNTTI